MIVIIAENDSYGLIQNFDSPRGGFLPFQIVGEDPAGFFEKTKSYGFNCFSLQKNKEAELKFFSSFEAF